MIENNINKGKYCVRKTINGKQKYYGSFDNEEDAIKFVESLKKVDWDKNKLNSGDGLIMVIDADLSDELLSEVSYVQISSYREKVMKSLEDEVLIPTQISKVSGIRTNHISKILAELKDHELVECINPEAHKGRLYRQTSKGVVVSRNLTTK